MLRRGLILACVRASLHIIASQELMDPKSPFRQTQRDIDAVSLRRALAVASCDSDRHFLRYHSCCRCSTQARGRVQGSSPKAEESTGFSDDDEMETDDFWSPGGAANSGWDVKLQGALFLFLRHGHAAAHS